MTHDKTSKVKSVIKTIKSPAVTNRIFIQTFFVMFISAVTLMLGTLIDGLVIGNFLSTEEMAAYGLISPFMVILMAIGGIFSSGAQILCGNKLSRGKIDEMNGIFSLTFSLTLIISIALTAIFIIFSDQSVVIFGASDPVLFAYGKEYFIGLVIGIPGVLMSYLLAPIMQMDSDQFQTIIAVIVMTAVNIAGDYINAIVIHGGLLGMGIATSISMYVAFFILMFHFLKKKAVYHFSFKNINWSQAKDLIITGLPTAGCRFFATFRTLGLNRILIIFASSSAVAAFSARMNVGSFFASFGTAVGMTVLSISGVFYGEEDRHAENHLFKITVLYSLIIGVFLLAIILVLSPFIMPLYMKADAETTKMAVRAMQFCSLSMPLYVLNNGLTSYLQSINKLALSNIILFFQNFAFAYFFARIFVNKLGVDAVWASYLVCEILTTILYIIFALIYKHKEGLHSQSYLFLPNDFGPSSDDIIEFEIRTHKGVEAASAMSYEFCYERCHDEKRASIISLAIEERLRKTLKYGYEDKKKHQIEVRIFKKGEHFIIRIRDDGTPFNPKAQLDLYKSSYSSSNNAIQMLSAMAKDITYVNIMNLNNLIIVV